MEAAGLMGRMWEQSTANYKLHAQIASILNSVSLVMLRRYMQANVIIVTVCGCCYIDNVTYDIVINRETYIREL